MSKNLVSFADTKFILNPGFNSRSKTKKNCECKKACREMKNHESYTQAKVLQENCHQRT